MLRASRRTLKRGRPLVFLTIEPGADLSPSQRRKAGRAGPPSVLLPTSYSSLLRTAGFIDVEIVDLTADYRLIQQAKINEAERRREDLIALIGREEYEESRRNRRNTIEAIDAGLLRRRLYAARRR